MNVVKISYIVLATMFFFHLNKVMFKKNAVASFSFWSQVVLQPFFKMAAPKMVKFRIIIEMKLIYITITYNTLIIIVTKTTKHFLINRVTLSTVV